MPKDRQQITIKVWATTRDALQRLSGREGESMVRILDRLVQTELERSLAATRRPEERR